LTMDTNFPVVRPSQGIRSVAVAMRAAAKQGTMTAAVFSQVADKSLDILADRVAEAEELQARTHARLQAIEAAVKEALPQAQEMADHYTERGYSDLADVKIVINVGNVKRLAAALAPTQPGDDEKGLGQ
jgi:uncharacterized protein YicC (UPF0701 family)